MAQTESMEDILTSIRSGVEGAAAGTADVLELAPDDILDDAGTNGHANGHAVGTGGEDELIDINAFAMHGEEKAAENVAGGDVLGEADVPVEADEAQIVAEEAKPSLSSPPAPVAEEAKKAAAEDEFDKLLAELGGDEGTPEVVETAAPAPVMAPVAVDEPVEVAADVDAPAPAVAAVAPADVVVPPAGARMVLPALEGVGGLQVAFPAEVLAAALRPMVKDWVAENLPAIVERLVKEEIGKLTQE